MKALIWNTEHVGGGCLVETATLPNGMLVVFGDQTEQVTNVYADLDSWDNGDTPILEDLPSSAVGFKSTYSVHAKRTKLSLVLANHTELVLA